MQACLIVGIGHCENESEETNNYYAQLCANLTSLLFFYFPDWCLQDDVGPIFPANPNERMPAPESLTKFFLDRVLDCMSTQVCAWSDSAFTVATR